LGKRPAPRPRTG